MWKWTKKYSDLAGRGARVLLVTGDEEYRKRWQQVFDLRDWELNCTRTLAQALNIVRTCSFPVIVYDCRVIDEDWRDVLNSLSQRPDRPCVLLASNVIDENFRDEVVQLHGYDVFSRHADEDEIARTINSAWFWKQRHA